MLIKTLLLHLSLRKLSKQVCFDAVQGWQRGGGGTGAPTYIIIRNPFTELVYRSRLPLYEDIRCALNGIALLIHNKLLFSFELQSFLLSLMQSALLTVTTSHRDINLLYCSRVSFYRFCGVTCTRAVSTSNPKFPL